MSSKVVDIDRGWNRIRRELARMAKSFVKVGVLSNAGTEEGGMSLVDVAVVNEYGAPEKNIPERPFIRQTLDTKSTEIAKKKADLADKVMTGKMDTRRALDDLGVWATRKIKETFTKGDFTPNAPATIKRKGSSRPLIDTGRLRQSINHETEIKG